MEMDCEHSEREGKSLTAMQSEGATQAPAIDANLGTVFILDK